jgi:cytochrome oxidase Cu insertion factor (SCO1/SenC/PrrC family)
MSKAAQRAAAAAERRQRRRARRLLRLLALLALAALLTAAGLTWRKTRPRAVIPVAEPWPAAPALVDDRGQPLTRAALAGHALVVGFAFFHDALHAPARRPPPADLGALDAGVRLLTVTLDPTEDTPDHLASVAATLQVTPPWSLVSGPEGDVTALLDALEVDWRRLQAERARYGTPLFPETRLVLVDGHGRIRDTYDGDSWIERARLRAEAQRVAAER